MMHNSGREKIYALNARCPDWVTSAGVARSMVRPVCTQLQKCRVHPGGYAWCHKQTSSEIL